MKSYRLFIILLMLALLGTSCNLNRGPADITPTTEEIAASPTTPPSPTAEPTQVDPAEIENTYEDPVHGFAFTYSGLWTLKETVAEDLEQNKVLRLQMDSVLLEIEYGFQFEFNGLQPLALPFGDVMSQEPAALLGQPLPKTEVVEEDRIKMVMYPAELDVFQIDDLFFRITLQETGPLAQDEIDLSGTAQEEAQAILGSFVRIERSAAPADPYPGWNTYLNVGYGFMLRYPTDWQAEEMQVEVSPAAKENAVIFTRDNANLMLVYEFKENFLPEEVQFLGGLLVDQGTGSFLGRQIQKLALVYNEKVKEILYHGLEPFQADTLTFRITLMDNRAGIGYDQLEVPDAVQAEADSILLTARQFPAALTPPEVGLQSEGKEIFLTFGSCFDLDQGQQVTADDPTCDFLATSVPGGGGLRIDFEPAAPAGFGFESVFVEQPQASQCAGTGGLSSQAETIAPLDSYHICFQTNAGRYGYLIFRALTSDGVSFDWQTFTVAGPLGFSASQQNAAITRRDVTVPDGTVFAPGETFEKTWELMNTGTTTWTTDYAIRFQDGNRLGAPFEVSMPQQVAPGRSVNISVQMVAPQEPGTYRSDWVLRDAQGRPFGVGNNETFWVEIVVEEENPPEEEEEEAQSEDTPVVETTLKVDPASFTGTCPAMLTVNFSITTEGTDHYTYELQAGAAQSGFEFYMPDPSEVSLSGTEPNTKAVEYTLTMQNSVEGWLQLVVTDPGEHRSQKVYFTVVCE